MMIKILVAVIFVAIMSAVAFVVLGDEISDIWHGFVQGDETDTELDDKTK